MALIYAYGIYLENGGRPDDFQDFSNDDLQIMLSVNMCRDKRKMADIAKMFAKPEQ